MTQQRIISLRGATPTEFRRLREKAGLTLDEARALLERKGGTMSIDFIRPTG